MNHRVWEHVVSLRGGLEPDPPLDTLELDLIEERLHLKHQTLLRLSGPIKSVLIEHMIFLQRGMDSTLARWMRCHNIGHLLYHGDESPYYACGPYIGASTLEIEAELFAGYLLIGHPQDINPRWTPWQIAEWARVPPDRVLNWLSLTRTVERPRLRIVR